VFVVSLAVAMGTLLVSLVFARDEKLLARG
jgi:hypothetical protein